MIVNRSNLDRLFLGIQILFTRSLNAANPVHPRIAQAVSSSADAEIYHMISSFPKLRKWLGELKLANLTGVKWQIDNEEFYAAEGLSFKDIRRDKLALLNGRMTQMGVRAAQHPDSLLAALLASGFTAKDYTGKNFFDTGKPHVPGKKNGGTFDNKLTYKLDHSSYNLALMGLSTMTDDEGEPVASESAPLLICGPKSRAKGTEIVKSAKILGSDNVNFGTADLLIWNRITDDKWYLVETANAAVKPFIVQTELEPQLVALDDPKGDHAVKHQEALYKVSYAGAAGFGMPQVIIGSTGADAAP